MAKPPAFELVPPALEHDAQEALAHGGDEPAADELAARRARGGRPALREALRFPTADPAYRRSLAVSLHVLGRDEEALREFDALLRLLPWIRAPLRFAIRTEEPYFVEKDPIVL